MRATRQRARRASAPGALAGIEAATALPAVLPVLLRAAASMPAGASACDVLRVLEAHLPRDDAQAAGEAAAELLTCALSGAARPVPLLRMAEYALHMASRAIEYPAWRDAGFPPPNFAQDHQDGFAWAREHAGPPA